MTPPFLPTAYKLLSAGSGRTYDDTGWMLDPPGENSPSLLRSIYNTPRIELTGEDRGLYTFSSWLPINRTLLGSSAPVTYRSLGLAHAIGLENLYITFSGYWPERRAGMLSCSFKETEAYTVCARLKAKEDKILVVASAGNTARAFARVCSDNDIPLLLCVPEDNTDALWSDKPPASCVHLVVTPSGSDYFDAISLSNRICGLDGFFPEGGAKNVARRDGMGTTVLSAATAIGGIPDYYFQAVGSGTGAIAAWEANLRLLGDGRFGNNRMKLMLSQNSPFLPMHDAWKADSRELPALDEKTARKQIETIDAKVLSNRKPPYSVSGGLYDAMKDAGGDFFAVSNQEALAAALLFEKEEGVDIHPAAAVAVASLEQAVREHRIDPSSLIMLNITGGGEKRFKAENRLHYLRPDLILDARCTDKELTTNILKIIS